MPLPPIISCFIKIQNGRTFLVAAYPGCPEKEAIQWASLCLQFTLCMQAHNHIHRDHDWHKLFVWLMPLRGITHWISKQMRWGSIFHHNLEFITHLITLWYTSLYRRLSSFFCLGGKTNRTWSIHTWPAVKTRSSAVDGRTEPLWWMSDWGCQWRRRRDWMHGKKIANTAITSHLYPQVDSSSDAAYLWWLQISRYCIQKVHNVLLPWCYRHNYFKAITLVNLLADTRS